MLSTIRAKLLSGLAIWGIASASMLLTSPAALADDDLVSVGETISALEKVSDFSPGLLAEDTQIDAVSARTLTSIDSAQSVSTQSPDGSVLDIGIEVNGLAPTPVQIDNKTVFEGLQGVSSTVIPFDGGVQFLSTIDEGGANRITFRTITSEGDYLELTADGGAGVFTETGELIWVIPPAWALDSDGAQVPTHYELDGNDLVQVIDDSHVASSAYPIVADPIYYLWGGKQWFGPSQVNAGAIFVTLAGLGVPLAAGPAAIAGIGLTICNWEGRGIWVYWTWAGQVWCTGP